MNSLALTVASPVSTGSAASIARLAASIPDNFCFGRSDGSRQAHVVFQ
jgi:hypothetical protein